MPDSARDASQFARALPRQIVAQRDDRAGLGDASQRHRSEIRHLARGAGRSCRCCASPICRRCRRRHPPFGGFNVTPPGKAKRLLMSPGPIFEPRGPRRRTSAARRARCSPPASAPATSCTTRFSYHLTPGAFILEAGAHALGCAVIPGGVGNTEQQLEAIAHYKPSGYIGTPDFLKILLDTAREDRQGRVVDQARAGVRRGAAGLAARRSCAARGVAVLQCYAIAETGVIAYESEAREGMIVNENLILEIVRPGTGDPVADGEVGEVVVTSFNPDYPMIRLATGDLSAVLPGALALRPHQHAHQGLDGPRRPDHQGQGHVRASRAGRRGRQAPSASSAACGSSSTREAEQDAMTLLRRMRRADAAARRRRSPRRCSRSPSSRAR